MVNVFFNFFLLICIVFFFFFFVGELVIRIDLDGNTVQVFI